MTQPDLFGFVTCDYEHQFTRVYHRGIGWAAVHRQNPRCVNPVAWTLDSALAAILPPLHLRVAGADCERSD